MIPDIVVLEPRVFSDERGFFFESWNRRDFAAATGADVEFVQDNHSRSRRGVLRGLHYQVREPQGKLVRCIAGEVFDVAVDLRRGSPAFGRWAGFRLSAENRKAVWIPPGFAHGFCVLSASAQVEYKCTTLYRREDEIAIAWDDPELAIAWPVEDPLLSPKDRAAPRLRELEAALAAAPA